MALNGGAMGGLRTKSLDESFGSQVSRESRESITTRVMRLQEITYNNNHRLSSLLERIRGPIPEVGSNKADVPPMTMDDFMHITEMNLQIQDHLIMQLEQLI
jgi:hypothetical protein